MPGSWLKGIAECQNARCQELPPKWRAMRGSGTTWEICQQMECQKCKSERRCRRRVLPDGYEGTAGLLVESVLKQKYEWKSKMTIGSICTGEKVLRAKEHALTRVIVPNNDVRTEINKQRARRFALEHRKQIAWCFAKDTFPTATLAADPNLPARKLEFLQRHDRECADLPGLVPLVVGLPVTLSEHVDREKGLLRGALCTMVGWRVAADETALPSNLPEVPRIAN